MSSTRCAMSFSHVFESSDADTAEKAFELYQSAKKVMSAGGFNLRKWNSNSSILKGMIRAAEKSVENESSLKLSNDLVSKEEDKADKLLGVLWDSNSDEFIFKINEIEGQVKKAAITKRALLQFMASIFDPLGFLSPFIIRLKILFQVLCTGQVKWNDPLSGELLNTWNFLVEELHLFSHIKIPHYYFELGKSPINIQIYGFSDASERAYAAVLYIRCDYGNNVVHTRLITFESRVAPVKKQTIPRLELLGALILATIVKPLIVSTNEFY